MYSSRSYPALLTFAGTGLSLVMPMTRGSMTILPLARSAQRPPPTTRPGSAPLGPLHTQFTPTGA
jgi:hypothetical protein